MCVSFLPKIYDLTYCRFFVGSDDFYAHPFHAHTQKHVYFYSDESDATRSHDDRTTRHVVYAIRFKTFTWGQSKRVREPGDTRRDGRELLGTHQRDAIRCAYHNHVCGMRAVIPEVYIPGGVRVWISFVENPFCGSVSTQEYGLPYTIYTLYHI